MFQDQVLENTILQVLGNLRTTDLVAELAGTVELALHVCWKGWAIQIRIYKKNCWKELWVGWARLCLGRSSCYIISNSLSVLKQASQCSSITERTWFDSTFRVGKRCTRNDLFACVTESLVVIFFAIFLLKTVAMCSLFPCCFLLPSVLQMNTFNDLAVQTIKDVKEWHLKQSQVIADCQTAMETGWVFRILSNIRDKKNKDKSTDLWFSTLSSPGLE